MRAGETIWVLGNGPSLREFTPAAFPPEYSIGVNRIAWCGFTPSVTVVADANVWDDAKEDLVASGSALLVGTNVGRGGLYDQYDDWPDGTFPFFWQEKAPHWSEDGVIRRGITGYMAAAIAARLVYPGGRVVLAGMDLGYQADGPTHAYDRQGQGTSDKPFAAAVADFIALRDAFQDPIRGSVAFHVVGNSVLATHGF